MDTKNDTKTLDEKWEQRIFVQCSCCYTNYTFDEYLKCTSVWINNDEGYGKEAICNVCAKPFHKGKWGIRTIKDIYTIYTTHTEMPQVPPNFHEDILDTNYFWETMIQNTQTDKFLDFQSRYQSQQDAIEGHWIAYDSLEKIILNPEKYPQGIMSIFFNGIKRAVNQRKNIDPHVKRNLR